MSNILHENERYIIVPSQFDHVIKSHGGWYKAGYAVINKTTEIVEVKTAQLPDAIFAAEQMDLALETKQWEWMRKAASEQAEVNPDGSPAEPEDVLFLEPSAPEDPEVH